MNWREFTQPRWLLSALLIAGAALFAIGVAAERNAVDHHTETATEAPSAASTTTVHAESGGESGADETTRADTGSESTTHAATAAGEPAGHSESSGETGGHSESSSETVLGIDVESNVLVAVALVISLALAVLTWRSNRRGLLFTTAAIAIVFAVFDIAEVVHQTKESRTGLAVLAVSVAMVHLVTAAAAQQRTTVNSVRHRA